MYFPFYSRRYLTVALLHLVLIYSDISLPHLVVALQSASCRKDVLDGKSERAAADVYSLSQLSSLTACFYIQRKERKCSVRQTGARQKGSETHDARVWSIFSGHMAARHACAISSVLAPPPHS